MKALQIPQGVRDALAARSGGVCERCGRERATQAHHRRPRAMGGSRDGHTNTLANLLHLGDSCHEWVESYRAEATRNGWLVRQGYNPETYPVWLHSHEMPVLLRADGTVRELSALELIELAVTVPFDGIRDYPSKSDQGGR